uniref:Reverse transcriptase domain-containing protein n=1 Tax=Tanacetum cinerariifolium TaxID=118510 RepID=A0A6L2N7Q5_TANCI|nr:hypothetical protein [Tanacetum cinerariifolium]
MRELAMKYKAGKVCHGEMVKMLLVNLKVLETSYHRVYQRHLGLHEVKGGARVAFEDEFRAAEEREVLCEAQQGRSGVKRKLFGSFRNKMGNEAILALPKGSDNFVVMCEARAWWFRLRMLEALGVQDKECDLDGSRASATHFQLEGLNMRRRRWMELFSDYGDVRTLIMKEAHATRYSVRPGAEIGESKMIGLELEQEMTKVVVIKERLKEAKDRVVLFGKKGELAPRLFARLIEEFGFALHRGIVNWHVSENTSWPIVVRHESKKTAWPIMVRHAYVKIAWPSV